MVEGRIRIQDVAAQAGVSSATVSLVLSGRFGTRVSAATAERVRAVAAGLGYRLAEKAVETRWLTVVVDAKAPQRLVEGALAGVMWEAWRTAHAVAVVPVGVDSAAAGVAAAAGFASAPRQHFLCLTRSDAVAAWGLRLPDSTLLVVLDDGGPLDHQHRFPRVVPEAEPAARTLARALAQRGHREVAVVSDGVLAATGPWTRSLERAGLRVAGLLDVDPVQADHAEAGLRRLLVEGPADRRATAVVCLSPRAVEVVRRVVESGGLRVPQDVSVVVQDDGHADVDDVLPSAAFPAREMGMAAARVLLDGPPGSLGRSQMVVHVPRNVSGERRIQRAAREPESSLSL